MQYNIEDIVHVIKERGLTGYKIAEETGLSEVGVNKIINGKSKNPRSSTLEIIHNYLHNKISETAINTNHKKNIGVPFYDIDVTASNIVSFNDYPELPEYNVDFKPFNDCIAMLPVVGDSMYPEYKNGDIVAIKEAPTTHYCYGETHLIITKEGYRTIKKLRKHKDDDKIILKPVNPNYDEDTILKEDILKLYLVKGQFKIHSY